MPTRHKNKTKQQKKSRQQLKKDRKKLQAQIKHDKKLQKHNKSKKCGKPFNEYSALPHKELLVILIKGYKECDVDAIQKLRKCKKNLTFKQQILAECFNSVWTKCHKTMQSCSDGIMFPLVRL
eukprot:443295_1